MPIEYAAVFGHKNFLIDIVTEIEERKVKEGELVNIKFIVEDILNIIPQMKVNFFDIMDNKHEIKCTLLCIAAISGNEKLVEWILSNSLPAKEYSYPTPLHCAIIEGNTEIAKILLRYKYTQYLDKKFSSLNNVSHLHLASYCGNIELVKMMLEMDRKILGGVPRLLHPINVAAYEGHKDVVEILLDHHFRNLPPDCPSWYYVPFDYTLDNLVEEIMQLGKRASQDEASDLFLMALKENNSKLARTLMPILFYSFHRGSYSQSPSSPHLKIPKVTGNRTRTSDPWLSRADYDSDWLNKTIKYREHTPKGDLQENDERLKYIVNWDYPNKPLCRILFPPGACYASQFTEMICYNGDMEIAKMSGLDFYPADSFVAGIRGHLELGKYLIEVGKTFHNGDVGTAFLNGVCLSGNVGLMRICLKTMQLKPGAALYKAACCGRLKAVRELLKRGVNINEFFTYHGMERHTALHGASQNGHLHVVRELINRGADINARIATDPAIIVEERKLLEGFSSWIVNTLTPFTPLQRAISTRQFSVARELINAGAILQGKQDNNMNTNIEDVTTLFYAVRLGAADIVGLCLRRGNYKLVRVRHFLCIAAYYGHLEVAKVLIPFLMREKGKLIGDYYLNCAIEGGHVNMAKLLIENGATVDNCLNMKETNIWGIDEPIATFSSVHTAVDNGHVEMVQFLLEQGVRVDLKKTSKKWGGETRTLLYSAINQQWKDSGGSI